MSNKGYIKEIRLFDKALTVEEVQNNIFGEAISIHSVDHLIKKECKMYDLIREDGEKLIVTSKTTSEEIEKWASGQNANYGGFYNQVNQDEKPIEMQAPPYKKNK